MEFRDNVCSRFQQTLHTRVPNYIWKLTSGQGISELHFKVRKQFRNFDLKYSSEFECVKFAENTQIDCKCIDGMPPEYLSTNLPPVPDFQFHSRA